MRVYQREGVESVFEIERERMREREREGWVGRVTVKLLTETDRQANRERK